MQTLLRGVQEELESGMNEAHRRAEVEAESDGESEAESEEEGEGESEGSILIVWCA